jgi:hypothetical protein
MNKTIVSIIFIIIVTFLGISIYKINQIPTDTMCPDFNHRTNARTMKCSEYTFVEKFKYVWNWY